MTESQLLPLIHLRWRMVRSRRGRRGFVLLAAALPGTCLLAVAIGSLAPAERSFDVTLVAPTVYLSAALLASVAPLVAGGGHELFPPDQLVAYPIRSKTQYYASLALTPLNLAWTAQLLGLLGLTAFITPRTPWLPLALLLCLAYISLVTVAGHAVAWLVVGVRQHRAGRLISWGVAGAIVGSAAALTASERVSGLLDRSPTADLVAVVIASTDGPSLTYAVTLALVVIATGIAAVAGQHACAWALRLPGDATTRIDSQMVRRRTASGSVRGQLLAIDRASVWRSPSLRRGLLVLGILPGLVAAIAGVGWSSLVLLPALVSAGAGLLFGVNVFCLDGTGSMWLASQPHRPEVQFWAKAQVIAEVSLVAIFITLLAGGLRTGRPPAVDEAVALVACALVVTARVMAICLALSVSKPHRADLRSPRDAPAPPGIMAAYSVRLALSTTLIGLVFSALAAAAAWQWSLAVALPFLLLSARHVLQTQRLWRDPSVRGRVVSVVSTG